MDKKAKNILMKTFWGTGGWKPGVRTFAGPDFEYARQHGLMFDPVTMTYEELVERIVTLHKQISLEQVSEAFLHSLSRRETHRRSALSSWVLTRYLGMDEHASSAEHQLIAQEAYASADLNVLQFERIKWGGIRLNWLLYCWFDLDQFTKEPPAAASNEDVVILQQILAEVRACAPADSPRKLEKRLKDLFPSSKDERDVVLEILGFAGILAKTDLPRMGRMGDNDFTSMDGWQGQDGYSMQAVTRLFGKWGIR